MKNMQLFGILNITPDSFSDGGIYNNTEAAIAHARQMMVDGAVAIDIGAESTRPGAAAISPQEEIKRLDSVLRRLDDIPLSIDTRNVETAEHVLKYNSVKYINDVSGLENNAMVELAARSGIMVIVMHSLTVPADKNITLATPPLETLTRWFFQKFSQLVKAGVKPEKIIFDPGIGFGKTAEQSKEIIDNAQILAKCCHSLGAKILFGHSRKSFMGSGLAEKDRETTRITQLLAAKNIDFARVHDVKYNYNTLKTGGALLK